jgi:hypothetical protein
MVTAQDPAGRLDHDFGVVNIAGLKGADLANAMMKALTKAKRRATLSIAGLGWLDETELDTMPRARLYPADQVHSQERIGAGESPALEVGRPADRAPRPTAKPMGKHRAAESMKREVAERAQDGPEEAQDGPGRGRAPRGAQSPDPAWERHTEAASVSGYTVMTAGQDDPAAGVQYIGDAGDIAFEIPALTGEPSIDVPALKSALDEAPEPFMLWRVWQSVKAAGIHHDEEMRAIYSACLAGFGLAPGGHVATPAPDPAHA